MRNSIACSPRSIRASTSDCSEGETQRFEGSVSARMSSERISGITEAPSEVDLDAAVRDEKEIRGCIGYFDGEFDAAIDLLGSGQLDPSPLITHRLELERIVEDGFEQLINDRDTCVKVLVKPA